MPRLALCALSLSACDKQNQGRYNESDVGVAKVIQFGRVVSARKILITGPKSAAGTEAGAVGGAVAGGAAGSGDVWATLGGALAGATLGTVAEREIQNRDGIEYIVAIDHGRTLSIAQNLGPDDVVFRPGDRVMVQQCEAGTFYKKCAEGGYQRVLPVGDVEEKVKAARKTTRATKSHVNDTDEDEDH